MDVLNFFDDASRAAALESYWPKLRNPREGSVDLETLRICIRLLPPVEKNASIYSQLQDFVISNMHREPDDPQRIYTVAEICLSNPQLGWRIFDEIYLFLDSLESTLKQGLKDTNHCRVHSPLEEQIPKAVAYLSLLKCSYWLPSDQNHFVTPPLVQVLINLLGYDSLDDAVHDTLSALLSLLDRPVTIARPCDEEKLPWMTAGLVQQDSNRLLLGQQLWNRFRDLRPDYFVSNSSRAFRTWFQWVCHAKTNGIVLEGVYDALYWSRLQAGLLNGFAEQRKHCLGILCQSLSLARRSIDTPQMTMDIEQRSAYENQYQKYCTLFEIIVLDRYQNQIQACLPELTKLLGPGSYISSRWITTLLSAALNSKIQDGIRKLIGTWYIEYVTKEYGSIVHHASFFIDGFLPWVTHGSLFTSSLTSYRHSTTCDHGTALADVVARFVVLMPTALDRRTLFTDVLQFILDRGGRIFQYSIVYLLEGLLEGFTKASSFTDLEIADLEPLLRVSRLTGLPEIASDLCITYCALFCEATLSQATSPDDIPGYDVLIARFTTLKTCRTSGTRELVNEQPISKLTINDLPPLRQFLKQLNDSQFKSIQDDGFLSACGNMIAILGTGAPGSFDHSELCNILGALWDEADRQGFRRPIAVQIPPLFFHPTCIRVCVEHHSKDLDIDDEGSLTGLLTKAMQQLQKLAEGRSYLLSVLMTSLRKACFSSPEIISVLPFEDFLVQVLQHPPSPKKEFLFEIAAAEKLQQHLPHRSFASYYVMREWHAFAAVIDLLNRFPQGQLHVTRQVMRRLLEPWATQKPPVPIVSKWKDAFQLQTMLLLSESYISDLDAESYLSAFTNALVVEQWPRYRYLLEWIIARIYYQYPRNAQRILQDLANIDENSPIHVASLMKLAVLVAPFLDSEEFALQLMTQMIPFSAHTKVQIRHEAHWSFPIIWDLAKKKGWERIVGNPAFRALNEFVTSLDRFNAPSSSIRTLKLDVAANYTIVDIFQGQYLTIEPPEREMFTYDDMTELWADDEEADFELPSERVRLGGPLSEPTALAPESRPQAREIERATESTPTPSHTKSGFGLASLLPDAGPPTATRRHPASVILVASLIDNPTNLGGLSRISESFGLEALYISDLKHIVHRDFKATSVTSEKHLQIQELKVVDVPGKLIEWKRSGWTVVGVEQTDRSGILGSPLEDEKEEWEEMGSKITKKMKVKDGDGSLPKKCVLVLGSEKGGISAAVLAVLDRCVEIKTVGVTRSLNVQTAGGIAVYEWWREWGGKV